MKNIFTFVVCGARPAELSAGTRIVENRKPGQIVMQTNRAIPGWRNELTKAFFRLECER